MHDFKILDSVVGKLISHIKIDYYNKNLNIAKAIYIEITDLLCLKIEYFEQGLLQTEGFYISYFFMGNDYKNLLNLGIEYDVFSGSRLRKYEINAQTLQLFTSRGILKIKYKSPSLFIVMDIFKKYRNGDIQTIPTKTAESTMIEILKKLTDSGDAVWYRESSIFNEVYCFLSKDLIKFNIQYADSSDHLNIESSWLIVGNYRNTQFLWFANEDNNRALLIKLLLSSEVNLKKIEHIKNTIKLELLTQLIERKL